MKGCGRQVAGLDCCTVIHGDCNDYLWQFAPGDVDLVVADPPYGMSYVSGARKEKYDPIEGDDSLPVETIQQLIQLPRLASFFFMRWDNLWDHGTLPKPDSVLTWVKDGTGMGDLKHEYGRAEEVALFYRGLQHEFKPGGRGSTILRAQRTGNAIHSTQKPVELITEILNGYDFDMVLDPFMGSGTTGRAAKLLGKHFLGFEINQKYWETACDFITYGKLASKIVPPQEGPNLGLDW